MGDVLRLDRRCELARHDGDGPSVVITEARKGTSTGWLARIGPHPRPDQRLARWARDHVRASEMEIEAGAGTKTYLGLPDGLYEAESVWLDRAAHKAVLRVGGGRIAVEDHRGLRDDAVLAMVLGLTYEGLIEARADRLDSLVLASLGAGLAALEGSPKQLAWVETFRLAKVHDAADYLAARRDGLAAIPEGEPGRYPVEVAVEWLGVALAAMRAEARASWWISNVGVKGREALRGLARELRDRARSGVGAW